jgi:hypothetical protein
MIKYSQRTCPKNDDWFIRGGYCGGAHDCQYCLDNPINQNKGE